MFILFFLFQRFIYTLFVSKSTGYVKMANVTYCWIKVLKCPSIEFQIPSNFTNEGVPYISEYLKYKIISYYLFWLPWYFLPFARNCFILGVDIVQKKSVTFHNENEMNSKDFLQPLHFVEQQLHHGNEMNSKDFLLEHLWNNYFDDESIDWIRFLAKSINVLS